MLSLVAFEEQHFEDLLSWFPSEAALVQWGGPTLDFPLTAVQLATILDQGRKTPPTRLSWSAIVGGDVIGHAQLGLDQRNGNGLVSRIAIAPCHRGKSLAHSLLRSVVKKAFDIVWIERLELNVYAFNTPAIRTYERVGFLQEGTRRSSALVNGERWDTIMMGMLRSEWNAHD